MNDYVKEERNVLIDSSAGFGVDKKKCVVAPALLFLFHIYYFCNLEAVACVRILTLYYLSYCYLLLF